MLIFKQIGHLKKWLTDQKTLGRSIGFVPTMGALHLGHLSHVKRAKEENHVAVVSIFVNPKQFNENSDFTTYPRTIEQDLALLEQNRTEALFLPEVDEIYSHDYKPTENLSFGYLFECLEAKSRPGHFEGVTAVVERLLKIVEPDVLYLGQKDYQQFLVLEKLVYLLKLPIQTVMGATCREKDGLAMSSRNVRLSPKGRQLALHLSKVLFEAEKLQGQHSPEKIREIMENRIAEISDIELEYFEIADGKTLMPVINWDDHQKIVACIAARIEDVRLIDNHLIKS